MSKKYFLFFSVLLISANIGLSAGPARKITVYNKSKSTIWIQQYYKGRREQDKIQTKDKMIKRGQKKTIELKKTKGVTYIMWLQKGKMFYVGAPLKWVSIKNYGWHWTPGGLWPWKGKKFKGKTKDKINKK